MSKHISYGPWDNPELNDGLHEATIRSIQRSQHGDDGDEMLEIVLILTDVEEQLVTRIYMPREFSQKCQQRFWFFCRAMDLVPYDVLEDPGIAVGRQLVIDVATVHPTATYRYDPYSDVRRFLPFAIREMEA